MLSWSLFDSVCNFTLFHIDFFFLAVAPAASHKNTLNGKTLSTNDHEFIECHFLRRCLVFRLVYLATSLTKWTCRVKCA